MRIVSQSSPLVCLALLLALEACSSGSPAPAEGTSAAPSTPPPAAAPAKVAEPEAPPPATAKAAALPVAERIRVTAPAADARVVSPLKISGQARGGWYFEATFPMVLRDANGQELAKHYATADGEWMTEEFVPFTAELMFKKPGTKTGMLVLKRHNASGLPEHDAELVVPVRFAE
jgi:hypothetical protein